MYLCICKAVSTKDVDEAMKSLAALARQQVSHVSGAPHGNVLYPVLARSNSNNMFLNQQRLRLQLPKRTGS